MGIEDHLQKIGLLAKTEISEHQQKIMDEKELNLTVKIKMSKKIEKKIVGYKVVSDEVKAETEAKDDTNIIQMHEKYLDPKLSGSTYKIKTPLSDHAMYLTINDIILNEGSDTNSADHLKYF
ncbi:MAG: hypothetical protein CM15mP51_01540 [Porticoccaceae bacterium]|nr:MAG: hypothetical protein CM15mP51_01540 [Porticoccaceae bacterium]